MSPAISGAALLDAALARGASAPLSALTGCPYLLVELGRAAALSPVERTALPLWLARQACPVLGIATEGVEHPLAAGCDAVTATPAEAEELADNITAAPLAAMVLVQVLRTTADIGIPGALTLESLAFATLQASGEFRRWLAAGERPAGAAVSDAGPPLLLERQGRELHLCLNRPARRNALSVEMRDALVEALELALTDSAIQVVTLRGAGRCFSAGGELSEFGSAADPAVAHAVRSARAVPALLARCAARLTVRVHGAAVGAGAEMAAFAARVEASADAWFQLPEIRYGLIPGCGGCVSLPRRIGRLRTAYLALSARRLDARTARAWGLVDAICTGERL